MFDFPNVKDTIPPVTWNACQMAKFNDLFENRNFIDLRHLEDDRTVLKNPHKGWYWYYIDNGYKRGNYRELHDPADHVEDFPGLHHLYLRYDWGDIEVEEGKYDWSYIDKIMEEWSKYGYKFGMRICTYEGDGNIPFATPEYVFKKGARGYAFADGKLEPDYGDPIYFEALSRFMEEAGKKFANDPRVELIDVGTYGTWGEGHTGNGTDMMYSNEVIKKHIDLHVKNFPNKFIMLNDDHINSRWVVGREENLALMSYALALGLGIDDDSVCVKYYADNCGYNTLRTPWLFDLFWRNAPIVLEFEHYTGVSQEVFKSGYPFIDAMMRTHATFAGFHGYPRPWLGRDPYLTEFAANRLGYWYFIQGIEIPPLALDAPNMLYIHVENRGFSHAYYKYEMKIKLVGEGGQTFTQTIDDVDNRLWEPATVTKQKAVLRPAGIKEGNYDLYLGLYENGNPIKLALKTEVSEDGMYKLAQVPVRKLFG